MVKLGISNLNFTVAKLIGELTTSKILNASIGKKGICSIETTFLGFTFNNLTHLL